MDLSKLQLLNTETLQKMQAEIDRVLKERVDTRPMVGRTARFMDSKTRQERIVIIEKLNPSTIGVRELGNSFAPGTRWRVSYGMLKVDPVVRPVTKPSASAPKPVAPRASGHQAW